jgi:hypothetical protein
MQGHLVKESCAAGVPTAGPTKGAFPVQVLDYEQHQLGFQDSGLDWDLSASRFTKLSATLFTTCAN